MQQINDAGGIKLSDGTELEWRSRKSDVREPGFDDDGRIIDPEVAKAIVDAINRGLQGNITEASSKEEKEAPPLPYSLSAIQSEMSKRHGLPVSETTAACQALYEKKMQSYIGTDCRYLPESMHAAAGEILAKLRGAGFRNAVESSNPSLHYKCWNDDKVSAHHAIIPTGERGSFSNEAERLVYNAVSSRYIAQFHPESRSLVTRLAAQFGRDSFSASKSEVISLGWKAVDHGEDEDVVKATAKDELALKMADRSGP